MFSALRSRSWSWQPPLRQRFLTRLWSLGLSILATVGIMACNRAGVETGAVRVSPGHVCRSELPRGLELSCGTYGFGDLRYVCPPGDEELEEHCARTTEVAVRNVGRAKAYVSVISGPRSGVREEQGSRAVEPGRSAVLRPAHHQFLFDITLRGSSDEPSRLKVIRIR